MERNFQPGPDLGRSDPGCTGGTTRSAIIPFLAESDTCVAKESYRDCGSLFPIGLEAVEFGRISGREMASLWLWRRARELSVF